jgi:RNA recognition motif-containing protein
MAFKLYVGNLPFNFTEKDVVSVFSQVGPVDHVKLVTDVFDGRSRGFGFVEMKTEEGAKTAVEQLDGYEISGRNIRVLHAKSQQSERNKADGRMAGGPRPGGSYQRW